MNSLLNRREVLRRATLVLGGGCVCHLACGAAPKSTPCATPALESASLTVGEKQLTIDLSLAPSLDTPDSAARIILPERDLDILVVRTNDKEFRALGGQCTHAGRPLSYVATRRRLQCNNFGHSLFDLEGAVVKGPAEKPLKSYTVALQSGRLRITL
jgi:nitrite reductase/ring-hydroxylating ferredoxin subunit